MEWFGLEGTLKIICFQPPCHEQGHLPLNQVAFLKAEDADMAWGHAG